jgi:hypothetical protein
MYVKLLISELFSVHRAKAEIKGRKEICRATPQDSSPPEELLCREAHADGQSVDIIP